MKARTTVMSTALAAALISTGLLATAPAFAQDAPPDGIGTTDVPRQRLVDEYAGPLFGGDTVAAGDAITALRTGGDFTIAETVTRQATNPDGSPATHPDGTPKMETVTVETVIANGNGPMGWGEVDHSLGLAQALVGTGQAESFGEALLGTAVTTTVTNPDGTTTTTTTYEGGILEMRAGGMGWGQIAKELGFKSLGEIKSGRAFASTGAEGEVDARAADPSVRGSGTAKVARESRGQAHAQRADKADRVAGKPAKVERIAKVERPAKIDRPQRPERPSKPERVGRP